jgi:nitrous oxidase accessory protein
LIFWSHAGAATINVVCGSTTTALQNAINSANPGDTVSLTGTCNENVLVRNDKVRVFIDGNSAAIVNGAASGNTFDIRGKAISVQNLMITGGNNAVHVQRGASAVIHNNIIQNAGNRGILVSDLAFAVITANEIKNNLGDGILVLNSSTAHIGFNNTSDPAQGNNIHDNVGRGIHIAEGSSARIYGNTISNNAADGILVGRLSQANLSSNTINSNANNGVNVTDNSYVQLGEDNPVDYTGQPNRTTINNANNGITCTGGGNIRGHLGPGTPGSQQLNGAVSQFGGGSTPNTFDGSCPNAASTLVIP